MKGAWKDKPAAGFTASGGPGGDKLSPLHYSFTLAMQEPPEDAPNEVDKLTGEVRGKRVPEWTLKLR